ncbi:MAG: DUF4013 domain-containing protein [Chloroflexi bacterium]|nr:MAG: DUF4013 domain-containing protein [Chloroflexota bacterium]
MDRIAEAFTWPFRDPDWLPKLLIIALILLVPIVGAINGIGWMLASLDRLRAGEARLAPANFSHLGRGIRLFAVEVIYAICIGLVALVIFLPAVALAVQQGQGSANSALIAGAIFLNLLGFSAITVLSLALTFATPAIVLATDSAGIGGGIRVGAVLRRSRMNLSHTLIAGLMLIAASFVGSLGAALCGIGIVVTSAYALAMQAWIIRSFEKG